MHLIQIDVFDTQALQAGLASHLNVARRQAAIIDIPGHRLVHFRREHESTAPGRVLRQPPAEYQLGGTNAQRAAVLVGGVNEIDARVNGMMQYLKRFLLRRARPEIHGAETDPADLQRGASKLSKLHGKSPSRGAQGGAGNERFTRIDDAESNESLRALG